MQNRSLIVCAVTLAVGVAAFGALETIPPGTSIPVRTNERIDVKNADDGRIYSGLVERDVLDTNGNLAIPRYSKAELIVRDTGRHSLALDLESITVNGQRYSVVSSDVDRAHSKPGVGANGRTGRFVGGGALLGTIVGAIAGGGKGAAIGALAGGATGAGAEMATRGDRIRVPAESLLTFRIEQPLTVGVPDRGYDRDGNHYHNDYRQ